MALLGLLACAEVGCAPAVPRWEGDAACRLLRLRQAELARGLLAPRELVELSTVDETAHAAAVSAFHQQRAITALTVTGAVGLAAGLVMGFVVDPADTGPRIASYTIVGGAVGLGAIALGLGYGQSAARARAQRRLVAVAAQCAESGAPPAPSMGPAEPAPGTPPTVPTTTPSSTPPSPSLPSPPPPAATAPPSTPPSSPRLP